MKVPIMLEKNYHWNTKQLLMVTLINASQGVTISILIYQ